MSDGYRRFYGPVIMSSGILILLVLAVFLVNREGSSSVASDAAAAIVADNAVSTVAAVRTATSYALVLASVAGDSGLSQNAFDGLDAALSDLEVRIGRLVSDMNPTEAAQLKRELEGFEDATNLALMAMEEGRLDEAAGWVDEQLTPFELLTSTLLVIRDDRTEQVLVAGEGVGRIAEAVRFLILFLIPVAVMVAFWRAQKANVRRRTMTEEVEHHRRVAKSKDEFVADVSHELRTPLTGIYGFALALEESGETMTESERDELVGLIVNEAAELARMVDDLVAIGRIDAGAVSYTLGRVDISEVIEEVMKPLDRRGISIEYEAADMSVYADSDRLRQVLRNLVSNAVKYGGDRIAVGVWRREEAIVIEVIDDGPGVSSEVEERLFERYVHGGGSALLEGSVGLGLAIAAAFTEGMGGDLSYKQLDGLTVFQVALPTYQEVVPDSKHALAPLQA